MQNIHIAKILANEINLIKIPLKTLFLKSYVQA